jgi:hypothetical protein
MELLIINLMTDIPLFHPQQVIGSSIKTKFERVNLSDGKAGGKPVLMRFQK